MIDARSRSRACRERTARRRAPSRRDGRRRAGRRTDAAIGIRALAVGQVDHDVGLEAGRRERAARRDRRGRIRSDPQGRPRRSSNPFQRKQRRQARKTHRRPDRSATLTKTCVPGRRSSASTSQSTQRASASASARIRIVAGLGPELVMDIATNAASWSAGRSGRPVYPSPIRGTGGSGRHRHRPSLQPCSGPPACGREPPDARRAW